MTISITHAFTSAKGDGTDATLVRPSNWNAAHNTSMATGNVLGRQTAGAGAFEEIALSAFVAAALGSADAASFVAALGFGVFEPGDVKFAINPSASAGWIVYQGTGTLGDASSGATVRANADTSVLYALLWNNIPDTFCPVSSGRGANAAADFAAHKTISLPWFSGRTIVGAGAGGALSTRSLGQWFGEEGHTLTLGELPTGITSRNATQAITVTTNSGTVVSGATTGACLTNGTGGFFGAGNSTVPMIVGQLGSTGNNDVNVTSNNTGAGAHNTMQPSIPMWAKVKL